MKNTLLACGVAAAFVLSAGAVMATPLNPGLYNLTLTSGGSSQEQGASITGAGASRQIDLDTATMTATVSGTSMTGSVNTNGVGLSLTGTTNASGATGTFHATRAGRSANGTFSLTSRPMNVAHMQPIAAPKQQTQSSWDAFCAWFAGLIGGGSAPTAPTAPTGSGSTAHGLAPYTPPH